MGARPPASASAGRCACCPWAGPPRSHTRHRRPPARSRRRRCRRGRCASARIAAACRRPRARSSRG
eukprot:6798100-Prymnesium_polylepis.1